MTPVEVTILGLVGADDQRYAGLRQQAQAHGEAVGLYYSALRRQRVPLKLAAVLTRDWQAQQAHYAAGGGR